MSWGWTGTEKRPYHDDWRSVDLDTTKVDRWVPRNDMKPTLAYKREANGENESALPSMEEADKRTEVTDVQARITRSSGGVDLFGKPTGAKQEDKKADFKLKASDGSDPLGDICRAAATNADEKDAALKQEGNVVSIRCLFAIAQKASAARPDGTAIERPPLHNGPMCFQPDCPRAPNDKRGPCLNAHPSVESIEYALWYNYCQLSSCRFGVKCPHFKNRSCPYYHGEDPSFALGFTKNVRLKNPSSPIQRKRPRESPQRVSTPKHEREHRPRSTPKHERLREWPETPKKERERRSVRRMKDLAQQACTPLGERKRSASKQLRVPEFE